MLFNGLQYLSSTAGLLWLILFWRLAAHGRKISFINLLLALKFLLLALGSFCCAYFLFQLGFEHFFEEEDSSSEVNSYLCKTYLTSYMITYTFVTYPNLGIIFCRFIYIRYAQGLVDDMGKLLHRVILLSITVFSLHWMLIWPIRTVLSDEDYTEFIKGKICHQNPISELTQSEIVGKLGVTMIVVLFMLALLHMKRSALKHSKVHHISKARRNILTFRQQTSFLHLILIILIVDQLIVNSVCQIFNNYLGTALVFKIWWIWNLVMFLVTYFLYPIKFIFLAWRDYPEFTDLRPNRFPGQESPRKNPIIPYRAPNKDGHYEELAEPPTRKDCRLGESSRTVHRLVTIMEENYDLPSVIVH